MPETDILGRLRAVRCAKCSGVGYTEHHQPGHTHYETDRGEPCPPYHYKRIPCEPCAVVRAAIAEITKLREREREVLKWANCGGPPALKTCSVDGHAIYGSFTLYPDGSTVCELHAKRAVIATLRSQVEAAEGIAEALKEACRLLDAAPMSYPYNDRSHDIRVKASQALACWYEVLKASQEIVSCPK